MTSNKSISTLLQQTSLEDHDEILKVANNTLKTSKSDTVAQHVRLVALLKLDRYDDALRALEEASDTLKDEATLERAYALYRTGQLGEAQKVLASKNESRSRAILEAQIAYRLEDFHRVAALYTQASKDTNEDESEASDLKINRSAVDAQLIWAGQQNSASKTQPDRGDLEQFYTAFNAACGYIARGQSKQAEFLLNRAKVLCQASDDLSDAEKKAELLPIEIQQAYVLYRSGKLDEAWKLSSGLQLKELSDLATKHIAHANAFTIGGQSQNPYLAQRLIESTSHLPPRDAPFAFQNAVLSRNATALALKTNKTGAISKSAKATTSQASHSEAAWIGVANAAAHARNQTGKTAIKLLLPLLERRSHDVGLVLTIVQLYVLTKNTQTATTLLEDFLSRLERSSTPSDQDIRFAPGLVLTLVSLYSQRNRVAPARAELAKAARHWQNRSNETDVDKSLLEHAATALLESPSVGDFELAHDIFTSLQGQDSKSPVVRAGLVASASESDKTALRVEHLPEAKTLTAGLDVQALEVAGVAKPSIAGQKTAENKKRGAPPPAKPGKAKKIRRSRMPKNYDPNKKLDPERWLPLRDRSNYRPKGKKKGRAQGGGSMMTQGGAVADEGQSIAAPQTQAQQKGSVPAKAKQKRKGKGSR